MTHNQEKTSQLKQIKKKKMLLVLKICIKISRVIIILHYIFRKITIICIKQTVVVVLLLNHVPLLRPHGL